MAMLGKQGRSHKAEPELIASILSGALFAAALYPAAEREPITGDALAELAKSYLLAEAVIERVSRLIDREVLQAILRGVQVDLTRRDSAEASAEALEAAIAINGVAVAPPPDAETQRQ